MDRRQRQFAASRPRRKITERRCPHFRKQETISFGRFSYKSKCWLYYECFRNGDADFKKIRYWGMVIDTKFPYLGCAYYTLGSSNDVHQVRKLYWCDDQLDKRQYKVGLVFATYEETFAHLPKKLTQKPKRMTVGELIKALQKYNENLLVAGYSSSDEGDFAISKVKKAKVHKDCIGKFYCQGGT